jgi:hypothetical protein
MQTIQALKAPWTDITIDFITQLLVSEDPATGYVYNSIFIVVNRHTKYTEMLPFRHNYSIEKLAHVFKDRIIYYHSILETIISNRNKLFTLNFWTTLLV